jgi:membrane associated rhomboid family serine protease
MFLILPVGVEYKARRYPVVTFTLMGICTAVYLVTLGLALSNGPKEVYQWTRDHLWLIPQDSHWWTFPDGTFYWQEGMADWRTTDDFRGAGSG